MGGRRWMGVHPLIFEGGRRPLTFWSSAGWTPSLTVHPLANLEYGRRPPTNFLFQFASPPSPPPRSWGLSEEVRLWVRRERWTSTHFFFLHLQHWLNEQRRNTHTVILTPKNTTRKCIEPWVLTEPLCWLTRLELTFFLSTEGTEVMDNASL